MNSTDELKAKLLADQFDRAAESMDHAAESMDLMPDPEIEHNSTWANSRKALKDNAADLRLLAEQVRRSGIDAAAGA